MDLYFFSPETWPLPFILFRVDGRAVTLWHFIFLIIVISLISISPSPFRQITSIILFLLILTVLGFFSFPGLSIILLISIILGLLFRFVGGYGD